MTPNKIAFNVNKHSESHNIEVVPDSDKTFHVDDQGKVTGVVHVNPGEDFTVNADDRFLGNIYICRHVQDMTNTVITGPWIRGERCQVRSDAHGGYYQVGTQRSCASQHGDNLGTEDGTLRVGSGSGSPPSRDGDGEPGRHGDSANKAGRVGST
jgi:hypothetical protein